ncbi:hypothetical protein GGI35DRAFT_491652 [Trichoderma velutinum]
MSPFAVFPSCHRSKSSKRTSTGNLPVIFTVESKVPLPLVSTTEPFCALMEAPIFFASALVVETQYRCLLGPRSIAAVSSVAATGLVEQTIDQLEGHRLHKGAPYPTILYVVSYVVRAGRQQPDIINKYSYSARNFLDYGGAQDWSEKGDTLYLVPAEYEYTTTVQVDGGASTTYYYNKFHLTAQIARQQNIKIVTQTITYYATLNTEFDLQPPQYQLPKSVVITFADKSSGASRTDTTTTEFDAWGNPTQEIKTDWLSTTRAYYTVAPAPSDFTAPTPMERFTYLSLATAQKAPVNAFVLLEKRTTALEGATTTLSTTQYNYINQSETRDHGRVQQIQTWWDRSMTPGCKMPFQYDKLGRRTRATTAVGVLQEAVRCIDYAINEDGVGYQVSVTDAKGVQSQHLIDRMKRVCQVRRQDEDGEWDAMSHTYSGTFSLVKEYFYNAQGQMSEMVDINWLRASGENASPVQQRNCKQLEYDDWGQVCKNTETNQIALTQTIEPLLKDGTQYSQMQYRYDGLGRLVEEEDALKNKTVYDSDAFDRVCNMSWHAGRAMEINGFPVGEQTFDGLDRLVQKGVGGRTMSQAYQSSSPNPMQITTQNRDTFALTYEPGLPHLLAKSAEQTSISPYDSFVSQATYSMKGKLQTYTDVHAQEYCHENDTAGRLGALAVGTLRLSCSYGPGNRVTSTTVIDTEYNTSLTTVLTYDNFGREVERAVSQGDQLLYRLSQSCGRTGLIATRYLEDENGKTIRDDNFRYDVHSRLVNFTCTGSEFQLPFNLDDWDNIRAVVTTFNDGSQDTMTYAYNNDDDYAQVTHITHTHSNVPPQIILAYNANGYLTQDEQGQTLAYDSVSRLKSVCNSGGQITSQYDYDAAGRLIRPSIPNQPDTNLFYRENQLIGTQTSDTQTRYLIDNLGYWGEISRVNNTTQVQLRVADGHGSILSWMTPSQPNQMNLQSYIPYGYSSFSSSALIAFNGQWRDPITGRYHLGNGYRVYNPVLGRFHVLDPGSPFATFDWGDLVSVIVGLVVSVVVGVLSAGAGAAIEIGVGITVGVAANAAASPPDDLAAGRKPPWKSVAISALNGLADGILGEAGGRLMSAGFKAVSNFKILIGRAGSYTVNTVVDHSSGASFRHAVKDALPSEMSSHAVEGLFEIDSFPKSASNSGATSSHSANQYHHQQLKLSTKQEHSVLSREASFAKYQIHLATPHSPSILSGSRSGQLSQQHQQSWSAEGWGFESGGNDQASPQSVAGILNRLLQHRSGPVSSSQGKRQTSGGGALEALEKKRRMDDGLRNIIRQPASANF